ncbi:MAG: hypothetical protein J1F02_04560 [Lachnospiraceae bacterium]|nr:hypothetical protein [Lachnospiraceae bacterium]
MKIEGNQDYRIYRELEVSHQKNPDDDNAKERPEALIDKGVEMSLSKQGLTLAGELEPFIDTYDTTITLLKGVESRTLMDGSFTEIIADNYQNELQKLKENYSGKELDEKLSILDKAYEEAAKNASIGYVKYLRLQTGDIVLKPQTGISYATEEEAEKAYQEALKKDENREQIVTSEMAEDIMNDIKNILIQLKNQNFSSDKEENLVGKYMSYADIKKGMLSFAPKMKEAAIE